MSLLLLLRPLSSSVPVTTGHGGGGYAVDAATALAGLAGQALKTWIRTKFRKRALYDKVEPEPDQTPTPTRQIPRVHRFPATARRGSTFTAEVAVVVPPEPVAWTAEHSATRTFTASVAMVEPEIHTFAVTTSGGGRFAAKVVFVDVGRIREEDERFLAASMLAEAMD